MSPYPSALQLSPSVCLHLLCLLLLTDCSSSSVAKKDPVPPEPLTRLNTTQANCSAAICDIGVSENATTLQLNSEGTQLDPLSHTLKDSVVSSTPVPQPAVPQPAVPLPSTTTGSPPQAAHTGPITSTGISISTTTEPVRNVFTTTLLVTSTTTTTPTSTTAAAATPTTTTTTTSTAAATTPTTTTTSTAAATTPTTTTTTTSTAAAQPATTVKATTTLTRANTTVTITTTTGTKRSSPAPPPPPPTAAPQPNSPPTGMPPIQTSLPKGPTTTTVASTSTPADRNKPVGSGTRVSMVDEAGAALTRQLVDTASLLAVLLFGLLFFLVTVALFVTQAYESYRRKDYTQVDYLINGMYTDSGV